MRYLPIAILLLLASCSKTVPYTPKKYVLIIAGQSQAGGRGADSELGAILTHTFTRTKIWSYKYDATMSSWLNAGVPNYNRQTGWEPLNIKRTQGFNQDSGSHGLDPYFAYSFEQAHPNDTLFIIKLSYGGTPLVKYQPIDWNIDSRNEMYDYFTKEYLKPALGSLAEYIPMGFWWAQGETDGTNLTYANAYFDNLTNFFTQMGKDVPAVVAFKKYIALVTHFDPVNLPQIPIVRDAEKKYCDIASNNAVLIDCDLAPTNSATDKHFSAAGYAYINSILFPMMNK